MDTCVIVTAFRSRNGASRVVLDRVADRLLVPLLTPALFLQYEDVLKRPEQLRVSRLTLTQVDQILAALASAAEPVTIHYSWRPQLPDPTDELVLDAAVNGRAAALVTYNLPFRTGGCAIWLAASSARRGARGNETMSKATYPLKLPASIKAAAARLAKEDGVSLNQWITAAVAQKIGAVETAADFFKRRAGNASPEDLKAFLANTPDVPPEPGDEIPDNLRARPKRASARR